MHGVNQVYKKSRAKKAYGSSSVSTGKDTLAISDFAKELSISKAAVSQVSDVRQARVDDIKKQMEAGNYNITAAQVADKIIGKL